MYSILAGNVSNVNGIMEIIGIVCSGAVDTEAHLPATGQSHRPCFEEASREMFVRAGSFLNRTEWGPYWQET